MYVLGCVSVCSGCMYAERCTHVCGTLGACMLSGVHVCVVVHWHVCVLGYVQQGARVCRCLLGVGCLLDEASVLRGLPSAAEQNWNCGSKLDFRRGSTGCLGCV